MVKLGPGREPTSSPHDRRALPLIAISAAFGVYLFFDYWFIELAYYLPVKSVVAGFLLGVPLVLGYTGYSFWAGTIPGILPLLGMWVGSWAQPPIVDRTLPNVVNSFVINTTLALPVVALMYIIGVGLRDRDALSERARPLAIRLAATILLLITVLVARQMGYLKVFELH